MMSRGSCRTKSIRTSIDSGFRQQHARRHLVYGPQNRHTDPMGTPSCLLAPLPSARDYAVGSMGSQCLRASELELHDSFNALGQA